MEVTGEFAAVTPSGPIGRGNGAGTLAAGAMGVGFYDAHARTQAPDCDGVIATAKEKACY
jgi:hypothetical protein